jgi:hypothetical protein
MIFLGWRRMGMNRDERIHAEMQRGASQGFGIWYLLMLASLLIRQFYLRQSIEQYWDLVAIFLIGTTYVSIVTFARGAVYESVIGRLSKWMAPAIVITVVAVNYLLGNIKTLKQLIVTVVSAAIGGSLIMLLFYLLYRRWEGRI